MNTQEIPARVQTVISGHLMGGQQPIGGATIELWETGVAGYGAAATDARKISSTTSNQYTGSFTFPTANVPANCTSGPYAYLVATGGDSSAQTTSNLNTAIKQVVMLGACTGVGASTVVNINELTTVAAAYALRGFASDSTTSTNNPGNILIGAPSSNSLGLADAVANAQLLVNSSSGAAGTSTSTVLLPTAMINTLGNTVAACVNSVSTVASPSTPCSNLFTYATPPTASATAPADTFEALMNIAAYPGNQVKNLINLGSTTPPFSPNLAYQPATSVVQNDLTLGIAYANAGLAGVTDGNPQALVVDGLDNLYAIGGTTSIVLGTVSSSSTGAVQSTATLPVSMIAGSQIETGSVDSSQNLWFASNDNAGDILEIPSANASSAKLINLVDPYGATPPYGSTNGAIAQSTWGIAVDGGGNVWTSSYRKAGSCAATVSNTINSVCEF